MLSLYIEQNIDDLNVIDSNIFSIFYIFIEDLSNIIATANVTYVVEQLKHIHQTANETKKDNSCNKMAQIKLMGGYKVKMTNRNG